MSAYEEFAKERQEVDELLFKGYRVAGILEDLDGAHITFARSEPAPAAVELLLLTADGRKYVTTVLLSGRAADVQSTAVL
ncbi:hypothetical protein [Paenibacillus donghaensis]|uniref:Uncharacterized protein n=1 Tax=Paenibacillus donghaensis TaxID=414771 RepID=A0A2Z2KK80_9BACL|nr:hypothetical protein [Paenibacillus donghaensis]ASA24625.1 hypothetical protein B9T62_30055 [Paenibacillus donghaensis]